jgi:hypothetical protein
MWQSQKETLRIKEEHEAALRAKDEEALRAAEAAAAALKDCQDAAAAAAAAAKARFNEAVSEMSEAALLRVKDERDAAAAVLKAEQDAAAEAKAARFEATIRCVIKRLQNSALSSAFGSWHELWRTRRVLARAVARMSHACTSQAFECWVETVEMWKTEKEALRIKKEYEATLRAAEAAAAATLKESEVTAAFAAVAAKQKLKSHVAEASLAKDEAAARAASIAAATTLKEAQDAAAEAQASAAKRFAEVEAARLNTARLRVVGRLEHFALSSAFGSWREVWWEKMRLVHAVAHISNMTTLRLMRVVFLRWADYAKSSVLETMKVEHEAALQKQKDEAAQTAKVWYDAAEKQTTELAEANKQREAALKAAQEATAAKDAIAAELGKTKAALSALQAGKEVKQTQQQVAESAASPARARQTVEVTKEKQQVVPKDSVPAAKRQQTKASTRDGAGLEVTPLADWITRKQREGTPRDQAIASHARHVIEVARRRQAAAAGGEKQSAAPSTPAPVPNDGGWKEQLAAHDPGLSDTSDDEDDMTTDPNDGTPEKSQQQVAAPKERASAAHAQQAGGGAPENAADAMSSEEKQKELKQASTNGDMAKLSAVLRLGNLDLEATGADGQTALYLAANAGHAEAVWALAEAGANVNPVAALTQFTALHVAAQLGHADVVRKLLRAGADSNLKNKRGKTPVELARLKKRTAVVQILEHSDISDASDDENDGTTDEEEDAAAAAAPLEPAPTTPLQQPKAEAEAEAEPTPASSSSSSKEEEEEEEEEDDDEDIYSDVEVQFNGKGQWLLQFLSLEASGNLTFFQMAGDQRVELRKAQVQGCTVAEPKSARKGHTHAVRLDIKQPDTMKDTKYIIDVKSAANLTRLREALAAHESAASLRKSTKASASTPAKNKGKGKGKASVKSTTPQQKKKEQLQQQKQKKKKGSGK